MPALDSELILNIVFQSMHRMENLNFSQEHEFPFSHLLFGINISIHTNYCKTYTTNSPPPLHLQIASSVQNWQNTLS